MQQDLLLCFVGIDSETCLELPVEKDSDGSPVFRIRKEDRKNLWSFSNSDDVRYLTGDETDPLRGAAPSFLN